jgi:predicted Zn-ribbon and HTH transcriptional regulator
LSLRAFFHNHEGSRAVNEAAGTAQPAFMQDYRPSGRERSFTMEAVKIAPTRKCKRCEHLWLPRVERPVRCPKCKTPYWYIEKGILPQGAAGHRDK